LPAAASPCRRSGFRAENWRGPVPPNWLVELLDDPDVLLASLRPLEAEPATQQRE